MASFYERVATTGEKYDDGKKVPRVRYRCRARHGKQGHMHPCKLITEHTELKHECICGHVWDRTEGEK